MSGEWGFGTVFKFFVWGYLLGGLTLIPGVLVFAWFWCTTPVELENLEANTTTSDGQTPGQRRTSNGSAGGKGVDGIQLGVGLDDGILEKLKGRTHEPDACAGYFAVCREYVPGGVNGKPPDRTTPAGAVVAVESPSVYQSMYRSIFDRNKTTSPSIEASNTKNKKARNVFYVVLRYVVCYSVPCHTKLTLSQARTPHALRQRGSARSPPCYIPSPLQGRPIRGRRPHTRRRIMD